MKTQETKMQDLRLVVQDRAVLYSRVSGDERGKENTYRI